MARRSRHGAIPTCPDDTRSPKLCKQDTKQVDGMLLSLMTSQPLLRKRSRVKKFDPALYRSDPEWGTRVEFHHPSTLTFGTAGHSAKGRMAPSRGQEAELHPLVPPPEASGSSPDDMLPAEEEEVFLEMQRWVVT